MMARIKGTSRASHENETSCVPENDYPPIRRSRTRMMAEASVIRGSTPTSSIPQKRALGFDEEPHAPAVSSPLNPDFGIAKTRKPPPAREQREKKESLKKREAKGVDIARAGTPDSQSHGRKSKKGPDTTATPISLNRYFIPKPKEHDFDPPTAPILVQSVVIKDKQFYSTTEHVYNRKGFRYIHCIADPAFPCTQYHRASEVEPHIPRFDYEDSSSHILFDAEGTSVTTEKGYRMARANVGIREGKWYWECKILSGVENPNNQYEDGYFGGHVRPGFSRREASLDSPVGFDSYSYGLRDIAGQSVHNSRPVNFFPPGESICEGDVIGFEIHLPSLSLHKKVVEGTFNKAVDVSDDVELHGTQANDVLRDRLPIRYKSHVYFEQFEYQPIKEMEERLHPPSIHVPASAAANQEPNPNHPNVAFRTLPFSCIKVYKNGKLMGTPWKDLLAFLPLASKPNSQNSVGAREGLDDGTLGYYPSISVFQGGVAHANFGPDFEFPPPDLNLNSDEDVDMVGDGSTRLDNSSPFKRVRPLCERYNEQIAEDIVYDILDEVDLWMLDGGDAKSQAANGDAAPNAEPSGGMANGIEAAVAGVASNGVNGQAGELNEIVQDDE